MNKKKLIIFLLIALIALAVLFYFFSFANRKPEFKCIDSDGGMDIFTAGFVTVFQGSSNEEAVVLSDSCFINGRQADEGDVLDEYYCVGDSPGVKEIECEYGCKNGACLDVPAN